jgi:paraquat-inducible protein B
MSEPVDPTDLDSLPSAVVYRSQRSRLTLVWLVPAVAALIGGWIAVRAIIDRGPTITVTFIDADGIEAGKTKVRYKSVDVGSVKMVSLAPDLRTVTVTIEMAKFARALLVSGTRFWVVRPRLGASGVSGLGTLLSGAYIGMDMGSSHEAAREFSGLETPPVVAGGTPGKQFVLESQDLGSLGVGAPAYFHHIQVGQISSLSLNPDGHGVTLKLFVEAPYDRFVTDDTRFWHASGVDIAVDSAGVRMQTESLTAILAGGVALETPPGSIATAPASADSHFHLATNRDAAMKAPDRVVDPYILYFDESLRGLAPGSIVNFRGVDIGEVTSMKVEYDRSQERFRFPVLINVYPERIRSRYRQGSDRPQVAAHALVAGMIEHGFRAQLRTASLLTGQLYIALDFFPRSAKVAPQPELTPMPLPTIPGNLEELQNTIVSVAHKLDQLPLAKIGQDADDALRSLSRALGSANGLLGKVEGDILPEAKSTLTQAQLTLAQAQQAVAPETSLQSDLHSTLTSVTRAADSIRVLADYLDKHPEALLRGKTEERK